MHARRWALGIALGLLLFPWMGLSIPARAGEDGTAAPPPEHPAAAPAGKEPGPEEGEESPGVAVHEEIVIVAKRFEEGASRVTSPVVRLGREDIERRQAVSVTDILTEVPGVHIQESGPPGQSASIFIRGAAGTQTLVLLDGIPLNNYASSGVFNASGFTTAGIESVEVLRGSYGLLYGSEAIGGVVSMESRRGWGTPSGFFHLEGGSYGMNRQILGFGGSEGTIDYALTLSRFFIDGEVSRSEHESVEFVGRFGLDLRDDLRIEQTTYYAVSSAEKPYESGMPYGGPLSPEQNEENGLDRLAAGLNAFYDPTGWLAVRVHGSVLATKHANDDGADGPTTFDPDGTPGSGDEYEETLDEFHGVRDQLDWRLRGSATISANDLLGWPTVDEGGFEVELTFGGEYVDQTTDEFQQYPDPQSTTEPKTIATYLNANVQTTAGFVLGQVAFPAWEVFRGGVVNAGIRRDVHSAFGGANSLFAGARVTFDPTGTTFRSAYGEGFRAPVPTELYGPYFSNPELGPETSRSFDVGLSQPLFDHALVFSATWYELTIDNMIGYDFVEQHLVNFPEGTLSRGWEFSLDADLGSGFGLRGSLSVQDNLDLEYRVGYGNKYLGYFGLSFAEGPLLLSFDGTFSSALEDFDYAYTSPDGEARENPGRTCLLNLAGHYRIRDWCRVFARIENLLDYDYVVVPWGAKGLGIGAYAGVRLDF